ncbi:PRC-barrel domain containing protein, partial [Thioclava sp. BHET1]
ALSMSGLTMVKDSSTKDDTRDFFVVVDQSKDALKAAPEFQMDQQADASSTMDSQSGTTTGMTADSSTTASGTAASGTGATGTGTMVGNAADKAGDAMNSAANKVGAAASAAGDKASKTVDNMTASKDAAKTPAEQGYTKVEQADITAKDLKDAPVYGADNKKIGDISKLVLTADGKLDKAVVNVGGFLGIGGKSVAISSDQMQVMKKDKSDDLRVYVAMSEDQLKAMPDYSKG